MARLTGLARALAACAPVCALVILGCEPCPLHQQRVTIPAADAELAPLIAACAARPADGGGDCSRACARVFRLAVERPDRHELVECHVDPPADAGGAATFTLTYRADCR